MLDMAGWGGAIHANKLEGGIRVWRGREMFGFCVRKWMEKRLEKEWKRSLDGGFICKQVGLGFFLICGLGWGIWPNYLWRPFIFFIIIIQST